MSAGFIALGKSLDAHEGGTPNRSALSLKLNYEPSRREIDNSSPAAFECCPPLDLVLDVF